MSTRPGAQRQTRGAPEVSHSTPTRPIMAQRMLDGRSPTQRAEARMLAVYGMQEAGSLAGDPIADPGHVVEDQGWNRVGVDPFAAQTALDFDNATRQQIIGRARTAWRSRPLAKQAIALFVNYALGEGITFHAANDRVQKVLEDFWNDVGNRRVFTSAKAQRIAMMRRQIDGELFFVLFANPETGKVKVRFIDPLEITTVITDPEDESCPLYYERTRYKRIFLYGQSDQRGTYTTQQEVRYYADASNITKPNKPPKLEDGIVIHEKVNGLGQRGLSDLYAALDWLDVHEVFMQDRATVTHALAKVAWQKKVKGGPAIVAGMADYERSSITDLFTSAGGNPVIPPGLGYETNPPAVSGSTYVSNEGISLTPVSVDTGAANAERDGRMLVTQIGASVGIMIHYFGDGGDANLATATAMDLPMLKMFKAEQTCWSDLISRIFYMVIRASIEAGTLDGTIERDEDDNTETITLDAGGDMAVRITYPLIVQRETWQMMQAVISSHADGLISTDFASEQAVALLGAEDIEGEVAAATKDRALKEAKAAAAAAAAAAVVSGVPRNPMLKDKMAGVVSVPDIPAGTQPGQKKTPSGNMLAPKPALKPLGAQKTTAPTPPVQEPATPRGRRPATTRASLQRSGVAGGTGAPTKEGKP